MIQLANGISLRPVVPSGYSRLLGTNRVTLSNTMSKTRTRASGYIVKPDLRKPTLHSSEADNLSVYFAIDWYPEYSPLSRKTVRIDIMRRFVYAHLCMLHRCETCYLATPLALPDQGPQELWTAVIGATWSPCSHAWISCRHACGRIRMGPPNS